MALIRRFTVGKRHAREGDCVSVCWECSVPDSVFLFTDSGLRSDRITVADTGSTVLRIGRSRGITKVTLLAVQGSRKETRTRWILVTNLKTLQAAPAGVGSFRLQMEKLKAFWCRSKAEIACRWRYLPKKRKTLVKVLFLLWLALIAYTIISPSPGKRQTERIEESGQMFV